MPAAVGIDSGGWWGFWQWQWWQPDQQLAFGAGVDKPVKLLGVHTRDGESVKQMSAKVRKLLTLEDQGFVLQVGYQHSWCYTGENCWSGSQLSTRSVFSLPSPNALGSGYKHTGWLGIKRSFTYSPTTSTITCLGPGLICLMSTQATASVDVIVP